MSGVTERITAYLINGGVFNPELADHRAVRDLLIDARAELAAERKASFAWCDNYNIALSRAGEAARERDILRAKRDALHAKCDELRNEWNLSMDAVRRAVGFWQQAADDRDALRAELDAQADVHTQIQMQLSDERDALRALLREARPYVSHHGSERTNDLLARIDTLLNKGDGDE